MPFPRVIAVIIADYAIVPKLPDWINECEICKNPEIWANPAAYEAGLLDISKIDANTYHAAMNPALMHLIKANPRKFLAERSIWQNEAAFEWLMHIYAGRETEFECSPYTKINTSLIINNNHPAAIKMALELTKNHPGLLPRILANKNAWELPGMVKVLNDITRTPNSLNLIILQNPAAIEWIKVFVNTSHMSRFEADAYIYLAHNPHPWAVEYCKNKTWICYMACNPGIFQYTRDEKLVAFLSEEIV